MRPGVPAVARAALAAAFCGLIAHTFIYAAFLEDPLVWTVLAVAAGGAPGGARTGAGRRAGRGRRTTSTPAPVPA